ncbi:hypothetical protein MESS2_600007 [Mesorhizobium metallidurans STM 2683]|uniref:Uncharacterized protein n=1 Tax=Mesorhizobium metallidurans STM 2683 TaxID=1297569 RepID=M5F6M1_9HYPH|nr:hypothetical protein MESS2_600007 [Mesorhizobium metallidurans STM 2683]
MTSVAWVTGWVILGPSLPGTVSDIFFPARLYQSDQPLAVVFRVELLKGFFNLGFEVVADRHGVGLAPFCQIVVGAAGAGAHGAHVDRLGEAQRQFALGVLPAFLDDDLGGDIAPVDDDQIGHEFSLLQGALRLVGKDALPLSLDCIVLSDDRFRFSGRCNSFEHCRKRHQAACYGTTPAHSKATQS